MVICFVGHKSTRPNRIDNSTLERVAWQMRVRVTGSDIPRRGRPQWLLAVTIVEALYAEVDLTFGSGLRGGCSAVVPMPADALLEW